MCVSASVGCQALGSTISGFNMRTAFLGLYPLSVLGTVHTCSRTGSSSPSLRLLRHIINFCVALWTCRHVARPKNELISLDLWSLTASEEPFGSDPIDSCQMAHYKGQKDLRIGRHSSVHSTEMVQFSFDVKIFPLTLFVVSSISNLDWRQANTSCWSGWQAQSWQDKIRQEWHRAGSTQRLIDWRVRDWSRIRSVQLGICRF